MANTKDIAWLIDEVFRRISSGGREPVADLFTEDAVYEGIYADDAVTGREAISIMLAKVIPAAISPFRQWPIATYPVAGRSDLVLTEYRSDGVGVHDGRIYRNKYVGVIRLQDGKIRYWREYYDPGLFAGDRKSVV